MTHLRAALTLTLLIAPLAAQGLTPNEQKVVDAARASVNDALTFLEKVVNINSGTLNVKGVRKTGKAFDKPFRQLGFDTRWIGMPAEMQRAGHFLASRKGNRGERLLLIGHLDTVFERRSPFQKYRREGDTAYGPGVNDMKGGNVVILYALKALHQTGNLDGTTIAVILHGDEEKVGYPLSISRRDIRAAAEQSDLALGYEARIPGTGTIARRGSSNWRLEVEGKQGHSSNIFGEKYGSGAIFEASRILNDFHEQMRGEQYLTFNPGSIVGGTDVTYDIPTTTGHAYGKTNIIARKVIVDGGLRFITEEQKEAAREKMRAIVAQNLPQTSAVIFFEDRYPAMPPTDASYALLAEMDRASRDLGHGPVEAFDPGARGAADIAFVADLIAGLDGLGAVGEGGHTPKESLDIPEFIKTLELSALLLYRLTHP
ncbi:MAG: M20/M25/M40 family metallo-hydrolase [Candidatus Marinimicrobia bacterium]|nr:M20/M25/M40 family metallo-hydrolase [Candidatus Neomarinimicrobiota bacterium]